VEFAYKRGIDIFSGAINGNAELEKRLTQNFPPEMIINAQDINEQASVLGGKSIMQGPV
jgi:hypothetical protein